MEFYLIKCQPLGFSSLVSDQRSQDDDAAAAPGRSHKECNKGCAKEKTRKNFSPFSAGNSQLKDFHFRRQEAQTQEMAKE